MGVGWEGRRSVLLLVVACTAVVVASLPFGTAGAAPPSLVVDTTSGSVEGIVDGTTKQWRGVPYAQPPVGELRWRPPVPASRASAVLDAGAFASPCLQPGFAGSTVGSEDCLYLNVFAPANTTESSKRAVLVHLHPGANSFGQGYQDADAFTDQGLVVVTLNYRLGGLGFAGHPLLTAESGSSGEYGVLDQLLALQWVQDNIAGFGGDPDRVTLSGMSAGGFDALALLASPLAEGLIDRAAIQGAIEWGVTGSLHTIDAAERIGVEASEALGCADAPDEMACMRAVPAEALVTVIDVPPWIGGVVLPEPPLQALADSEVPLLIGSNREEESIWFFDFEAGSFPRYTSADRTRDAGALVGPTHGAEALKRYPVAEYGSPFWSYIALASDGLRTCPVRRVAGVSDGPVWRYLYANNYQADPIEAQIRAGHSLEEPLLWRVDWGIETTPAEVALGQRMTRYWANFAKSGNPNSSGLPAWPSYAASTEKTLVLDDQISTVATYHRSQCQYLDSLPALFPPVGRPLDGRGTWPPLGPG